MVGAPAFTASVDKALLDAKRLIAEGQFSEGSRLCLQAIRAYGNVNAFYRAKCYCDLQLRRWHSCLDTVRWLHGLVEHPSLAEVGNKRCPKRMRAESRERRAAENADVLEVLREAPGLHIVNGECHWLHFEQAYCYYKMGHYESALTALRLCSCNERPRDLRRSSCLPTSESSKDVEVVLDKSLSPKYKFLLAQVYVRLGFFEYARSLYSELQGTKDDPLVSLNLLSTNLNMLSHLDDGSHSALFESINRDIDERSGRGDNLSYEYSYNWSIAKVLENDFSTAESYLDISEERLVAELQSDFGDSFDIRSQREFFALDALRVFLLHHRGCDELASSRNASLMSRFMDCDGVDPGIMLIVLNNCLCLRDSSGMSTLVPRLESLLKRSNVVCKFSHQELLDVHRNVIAYLLEIGDTSGCKAHIMKFICRLKHDAILYHSLGAVDYAEGKVDGSISALKRGLSSHKGNVMLIRCLLNVLLSCRRFKMALRTAQLYESFLLESSCASFYWCVLLECHMSLGNRELVVDILSRLLEYPYCSDISIFLKEGCRFLESHGMHAEALVIYRRVHELVPTDVSACCGVLFNESYLSDPVGDIPDSLLSVVSDSLFGELRFIDAEELESEGQLVYVQEMVDVGNLGTRRSRHRSRRRRGRHLQQQGDTALVPPDPERWLPKYQRSAFKKQLKRKKELLKGHSQGASVDSSTAKPTSVTITTESSHSRRRRNKKK
ncbi:uncharacterized protein BXIN_1921 [Babesia sp. Xinjiang]|uniref:uncharacterized protein n=1 Tax=Babesia sp. Xinjiang TaxID=462227 RepID=UPI000A22EDD4|nr:uncharacterized protein BXIN_1921 [Babesia sp. Xinjiang]ORM40500.1 hypothetical protein BXIN_1921 [Babesia sp. Xinjiang]